MSKENAKNWYNAYCYKHISETDMNFENCVYMAAKLSYRSSVLRALYDGNRLVGFKSNSNKNKARRDGEKIIKKYLEDVYNSPNDFENLSLKVWDSLRANYHNYEIEWYKYGNAQKWANMAIKYFLILMNEFQPNDSKIENIEKNCWFPVDGIMIKNIKNNFGIDFKQSWSKCDNKEKFIKFIKDVKEKIKGTLFDYELENWIS